MDVFRALEGRVKPGLNVAHTTKFDTGVSYPAGPPVGRIEIAATLIGTNGVGHRRVACEIADADAERIGAIVRSAGDAARDNSVRALPARSGRGRGDRRRDRPTPTAIVRSEGGSWNS